MGRRSGGRGAGTLPRTYVSSSRWVTRGATTASPLATTRTAWTRSAGATSLSRKADAPAWSPAKAYSSRSKVVRMMIRGADPEPVMARVASMPSSDRHPDVHEHHVRAELAHLAGPPRRRRTPRPRLQGRPRPRGSAGSPCAAAAGRPPAGPGCVRSFACIGVSRLSSVQLQARHAPASRRRRYGLPPRYRRRSRPVPSSPAGPVRCRRAAGADRLPLPAEPSAGAPAVVDHFNGDGGIVPDHHDVHPAQRPAVAQHVGQRLLHDPVHGQLEGGVLRQRRARVRVVDRQASGAEAVEELGRLSPAASGSRGACPAAVSSRRTPRTRRMSARAVRPGPGQLGQHLRGAFRISCGPRRRRRPRG